MSSCFGLLGHCSVRWPAALLTLILCNARGAYPCRCWTQVHHEQYDCPYNGGRELSGCGGGMANFANKPRLEAGRLKGHWHTVSGRSFKVLQDSRLQASDRADRCDEGAAPAVLGHPELHCKWLHSPCHAAGSSCRRVDRCISQHSTPTPTMFMLSCPDLETLLQMKCIAVHPGIRLADFTGCRAGCRPPTARP